MNKFKALIIWKDNTSSESMAQKNNSIWIVGGDRPDWKIIKTILILSEGKIYKLQGNRLIFQDNNDNKLW